jgi:hypothetical protein
VVLVNLGLELAELLELSPSGADTIARSHGGPVGSTC